ncbi:MAG: hypothetical protein GWM90_05280, partial [Gemmatimonadetes bacterium]|nr:hypothetical protein [Gemmatimonadota bacterium]NIQ53150.1 hypothetical protein [Gemmatimonadota bacterium]NIU73294.1 hypothetical protein [Gammaproteobacteria bacterium]NIX43552.1 hypothetical protein [Gemmatimonadota bacterium]NIY07733.1 hypothetical protein [Gemmatimonadota bacterium]
ALVVDGDTMVALTREQYAEMTRRLIKLDNALEMIEQLEAVRDETESYLEAVDRQEAVADSLIAAQRAQIADYERLTTLLERLANRGRILSAELGAGYTADGHLTGLAGLGFGPVRVLGLVQQEDLGFIVAGWVPIW